MFSFVPIFSCRFAVQYNHSKKLKNKRFEEAQYGKGNVSDFSDDAYAAFLSGQAVDNNGFRSAKGNFYPDQPSFREIVSPDVQSKKEMSDAISESIIAAVALAGFVKIVDVVGPPAKAWLKDQIDKFKEKSELKHQIEMQKLRNELQSLDKESVETSESHRILKMKRKIG